jgi:hypothetical protein
LNRLNVYLFVSLLSDKERRNRELDEAEDYQKEQDMYYAQQKEGSESTGIQATLEAVHTRTVPQLLRGDLAHGSDGEKNLTVPQSFRGDLVQESDEEK